MRTLREHSRNYSYLVVFICLGCLTFLSACGGSGGGSGVDSLGDSSGTGTVSFSLTLQDQGNVQALSVQAADNSTTQFDCETNKGLIAKIEAEVYDENDELLAEGGPWNCEDHQGTISGVDAGDGRIVKVFAKDESGNNIFWGQSEPVTVISGRNAYAGAIFLETVNRSPELSSIGNLEINEGELLEFDISATDPDGDRLLFEIGNKPADAEFAFKDMADGTAIAYFSWMPAFDSAGNYKVMFKVTDSGKPALSDFEEMTISVGNVPLPPVLNPIGDKEVNEGEQLKFDINATDPDSINLRFETGNKPADASFIFQDFGDGTGTATFSWTPGYGAAGEYPVIFKVFDDSAPPEGPLSDFEEIMIAVGNVCRAPVLDPIVPPNGKKEGELIEFTVTAKDPDLPDDDLSFSCVSNTEGFDCEKYFNPSTQLFSWTPGFESAGIYQVRFIVTDSCENPGPKQDFEDVTITVEETCRPPILEPIGDQNINENEELKFTITAKDDDLPNDFLSFSCVSEDYTSGERPLCEFFDPSSRTFTWTPGYEDQSEYAVRFIVTDTCQDPGPLDDFEDVKIRVDNVNRPPVFQSIDPFQVEYGKEIRFNVVAEDPDLEDILTIDADLSDLPAGAATFVDNGNRTGTFRWPSASEYFPRGVSSLTFLLARMAVRL